MSNTNGYALVWQIQWKTSYHFAVAMVLARFSDATTGYCAMRQRAIAKMACCSKRQVQRVIDDMAATGHVTLIAQPWESGGGQASNLVRLTLSAALDSTTDRRVTPQDFYVNQKFIKSLPDENMTPISPPVPRDACGPIGVGGDAQRAQHSTPNRRTSNKSKSKSEIQERGLTDTDSAFEDWNNLAKRTGLPRAQSLTSVRLKHLKARIEEHGIQGWLSALQQVEGSSLMLGLGRPKAGSESAWRCSFDWLCNASNFLKVIEGNYLQDAPRKQDPESRANTLQARMRTDKAFAMRQVSRWDQDPDTWLPELGPPPGAPGCLVDVTDAMQVSRRLRELKRIGAPPGAQPAPPPTDDASMLT